MIQAWVPIMRLDEIQLSKTARIAERQAPTIIEFKIAMIMPAFIASRCHAPGARHPQV